MSESTETNEDRHPHVSARRIALGIVVALAALALIVVLIGRAAGFSNLRTTLREGDGQWLAVCAVGQVVVFGGYAGVFRRSLAFEGGPDVPPRLAFRVILTSFAVSQVVAVGGAAGLAVNYWAMRRLDVERRDAAVRLIGLNTVVYFVFAIVAWTAAVLTLVRADAPLGATMPWIVGVPIVWLAAAWFTSERRVARWAAPTGGRIRQALATGVSAAWWARRFVADRHERGALLWAAAYWLGDIASLWGALHAFGEGPSLPALGLVYVIGYLAQAAPVPFIGTGGMDAALTFALQMVGVPLEVALVAVIAHRVFAFWIPIIPGLVLGLFLRRTAAALDAVAAEARSARVDESAQRLA